jgi:hypothetical protein
MKWETVTSTIGQTVYALWNNGRKLVTLVFHPGSNAARIEYENERRVFLIRKEGFRKNKTVLRSEYGMLIGQAGSENNEHFIDLNDQRFFYTIDDTRETSLTIYRGSKEHPIAVCSLDTPASNLHKQYRNNSSIQDTAHFSLLMGLCWYLFHPEAKEVKAEYSL